MCGEKLFKELIKNILAPYQPVCNSSSKSVSFTRCVFEAKVWGRETADSKCAGEAG